MFHFSPNGSKEENKDAENEIPKLSGPIGKQQIKGPTISEEL